MSTWGEGWRDYVPPIVARRVKVKPSVSEQAEAIRAAILTRPKPSKYRAVRCTHWGRAWDSLAEARRFDELRLMGKAGLITNLELQPTFVLHVGETIIGRYRADFAYDDLQRGACVEDVKSDPTKTTIWRWKVKHVAAEYGVAIDVVDTKEMKP